MRLRASVLSAGLFLIACSAACAVFAQTADFQQDRTPIAVLNGPWRFHAGDDPSFANPAFDDSAWSLLTADKGWSQQGYPGYGGVAWYRLAITLPENHGPLALYIPTSTSVVRSSPTAGSSAKRAACLRIRTGLSIPACFSPSQTTRVLAPPVSRHSRLGPAGIRGSSRRGLNHAPRIGDAHAIAQLRALGGYELYWKSSYLVLELFANSIGALASLIMFACAARNANISGSESTFPSGPATTSRQSPPSFGRSPSISSTKPSFCSSRWGFTLASSFIRRCAGRDAAGFTERLCSSFLLCCACPNSPASCLNTTSRSSTGGLIRVYGRASLRWSTAHGGPAAKTAGS